MTQTVATTCRAPLAASPAVVSNSTALRRAAASHRAAASRSAAPRRRQLSCSPAFQGRVTPPATAAGWPLPGQHNVSAAALWPPAPQAASPAGVAGGRRLLVNVYSRDSLQVVNVYLFRECKLFIQYDFL